MRDPSDFDAFSAHSVRRLTGRLYAMTGSRAEPVHGAAPVRRRRRRTRRGPDHVALIAAVRRIPAGQRRATVLHHLVGLPVGEVARETRSRPGTVKARLARGRRALAPHLSDGPPDATKPSAPRHPPARPHRHRRRPLMADHFEHTLRAAFRHAAAHTVAPPAETVRGGPAPQPAPGGGRRPRHGARRGGRRCGARHHPHGSEPTPPAGPGPVATSGAPSPHDTTGGNRVSGAGTRDCRTLAVTPSTKEAVTRA